MKRTHMRIIAFIIAALMVLGLFSGALAFLARGAAGDPPIRPALYPVNTRTTLPQTDYLENIKEGFKFNIYFQFTFPSTTVLTPSYFESNSTFSYSDDTSIEITGPVGGVYSVSIQNIVYEGGSSFNLSFKIPYTNASGQAGEATLTVPVNSTRFVPSGSGSDDDDTFGVTIFTADTTVSRQLKVGEETSGLTVTFFYTGYGLERREYTAGEFSIPSNSSFSWSRNSRLRIDRDRNRDRGRLTNITYNGGADRLLRVNLDGEYFEIPIPNRYFEGEGDEEKPPASDIVVENVVVKNAAGQRLLEITEDTPPFTVEITYYDIGLMGETRQSLERARLHTFVTNATGFKTPGGTRGRLELVSFSQYPRFRATFDNIQSDGVATSFGFRVQYDLQDYDDSVKGEGTAILFQVTKSEEDDEIAPLKPNVIVESYGFGDEAITAGDEFDLDISFKNTSRAVGVENVVMTIEPGSGFSIAAASNTNFFSSIAPVESIPFSIALRANPAGNAAGTQTEYSVTVKFAYQYLSKQEYASGESSVKIAIPVVQLDRFSADEITDYTNTLQPGEEGYISVPITNKGKSPTYNITGSVTMPPGVEFSAPNVHFGNLEAGKAGNLDINIAIFTPGQYDGYAVIQYEDENMNQKELTVPFSIMVMEPFIPEPVLPPDIGQPAGNTPGPVGMAVAGAGGLMVAGPIALYFIKRMKAKGSEDMDEDF